jgi:3-carboxy-cis,cis-muconate cycloisomerase
MPISLFSSPVFSDLYSDADLFLRLDEDADLLHMIRFEQALAKVQGALGIIPDEAAEIIVSALETCEIEPIALCEGTRSAGIPVPALVASLRKIAGDDPGSWLHWGATSQDVMDTALVLQAKSCLDVLEERLGRLIDTLETESVRHANQLLAGRTRSQISTPVTFGYRIAQWAHGPIDAEADLPDLRKKVLKVQFGGASGVNSAVVPDGPRIAEALAKELKLHFSPSWHTNRSNILTLSAWLQALTAGLAKMAGDLLLLGRSDISEVSSGTGGGSSTMPQKANPVLAEAILTLNTIVQTSAGGIAAAASPAEERDGARWPLEWAFLPQMLIATGAALRHAQALADSMSPNPDQISACFNDHPEIMAEAASFALAKNGVPRAEAKDIVAKAASQADFKSTLKELAPNEIDWDTVLDPATVIPACKEMTAEIFARRSR